MQVADNQAQFVQRKQQAHVQLQQKIADASVQLARAEAVIDSARQALHQAQNEISAASSQGRIDAINAIQQRIDSIAQTMQDQSKPAYDRAAEEWMRYRKETVLPELEKVYERFNSDIDALREQITSISGKLTESKTRRDDVKARKNSRREFLVQARTDLIDYNYLLSRHNKFYFPVELIPQHQLLNYLECSDRKLYCSNQKNVSGC